MICIHYPGPLSWVRGNPRATKMSSASRVIFRPVLHRGPDSAGIGVLSHNPMLRSHRGGEFQAKWRRRKSYGLLELAEPIPKGLAANDMTNLERKAQKNLQKTKLVTTPETARKELAKITHRTFRKGLKNHWDPKKKLWSSICWLFCWAYSGMNSPETANAARHAFNKIFSRDYDSFGPDRFYEYASRDVNRYKRN